MMPALLRCYQNPDRESTLITISAMCDGYRAWVETWTEEPGESRVKRTIWSRDLPPISRPNALAERAKVRREAILKAKRGF